MTLHIESRRACLARRRSVIPAQAGIQTPVVTRMNRSIRNATDSSASTMAYAPHIQFRHRWLVRRRSVIPAQAGIQTPVVTRLSRLIRNAADSSASTAAYDPPHRVPTWVARPPTARQSHIQFRHGWLVRRRSVIPAQAGIQTPVVTRLSRLIRNATDSSAAIDSVARHLLDWNAAAR